MLLVKKHCLLFCAPREIKIILETKKELTKPGLAEPDKTCLQ
jgi:hypothetical protein